MAQSGTDLDKMRGGSNDKPRIEDKVALYKMPEKKWVTFRIVGGIYTYGGYWAQTVKKDGGKSQFFVDAPSYDPATQALDSTIYDPWRDLAATETGVDKDDRKLGFTVNSYVNSIHRASQKQAPRKPAKHTKKEIKSGFKDKDSDSYTPMVALRLPASVIQKLKEQGALNVVEKKGETKNFPLTHPKYGCDVRILYDSKKSPADRYQVIMGNRTPLTEEELAYLQWDLSDLVGKETDEEVKRNFESWATRNGVKMATNKGKNEDFDDEEEDDEEEETSSSKKKKAKPSKDAGKKGAKSKSRDEDDEDEDEDEDDDSDDGDDDDEDDEDEPKKGKSKSKSKVKAKSKKSKKDDDDEDEDSDDEDEDDDFDDDDDSDDEDDEDEDDAPKKGKGKKAAAKSKPAKGKKSKKDDDEDDFGDDDDEDDEDSDEDDEDEEDEPKKGKSKSKAKVKAKGKKSKKDDDEDEDDDFGDDDEDEDDDSDDGSDDEDDDSDDEDEDEDEDDAPKKGKSKSKVKAPAKKEKVKAKSKSKDKPKKKSKK